MTVILQPETEKIPLTAGATEMNCNHNQPLQIGKIDNMKEYRKSFASSFSVYHADQRHRMSASHCTQSLHGKSMLHPNLAFIITSLYLENDTTKIHNKSVWGVCLCVCVRREGGGGGDHRYTFQIQLKQVRYYGQK